MARYTEASCKLCRREGMKLFLKGERCYTDKCAIERRNFAPGQHGRMTARRRKVSDYQIQLREKQKVKRIYGVLEQQFRNYYVKASKKSGVTGENLLQMLETRLDNVLYRLGFAPSRKSARQLVRHRHIKINGRIVDIPSCQVSPGEEISVKQPSNELGLILSTIERRGKQEPVSWLSVDYKSQSGKLLEVPMRESIPIIAQEQLIVELYSK
ncbi:MAG: 30S ribosomal protein S4 [Candidatus Glassbacteria bacterium]|nr:30S ribosomal protein S4 [Candidatus Glassbacteria bacterium]